MLKQIDQYVLFVLIGRFICRMISCIFDRIGGSIGLTVQVLRGCSMRSVFHNYYMTMSRKKKNALRVILQFGLLFTSQLIVFISFS